MNENQTHYYTIDGVKYENMKQVCETFEIKSKLFKMLVNKRIIQKSNYNGQIGTIIQNGNDDKKTKTEF
ncbi:hypothetical protein [Formosa algae]|uniref:hypothetical protein n=1 Tax=Formosa algae TaxID=225843 RepID=UPI000CCE510A|nr:hypothetical protein [Formosa algae]PNW28943.1 hypothetical protein BKP44_06795 [Formosa algae]